MIALTNMAVDGERRRPTRGANGRPRGRRVLLQLAASAAAAVAGAGFLQRGTPARGADPNDLVLNTFNDATNTTTLRATLDGEATFSVVNLDGTAGSTALNVLALGQGTAIEATTFAFGNPGPALKVVGPATFSHAVTATSSAAGHGFIGRGSGLTNLNASNIATGELADARLSANVPRKNAAANTFTGDITAASFTGNGAGLTNLSASNIADGQVADARLSANVPLKDAAANAFTGDITAASFAGNGAGLTNLNAANIATGDLSDERLSNNVALKNASRTKFAGLLIAGRFAGPGPGRTPTFVSSGRATILATTDRVRVTRAGVGAKANILATLQSDPGGGVVISHVKKVAGGFDIMLSGPATNVTTVGWFVLQSP